jgi:hypothetical protein
MRSVDDGQGFLSYVSPIRYIRVGLNSYDVFISAVISERLRRYIVDVVLAIKLWDGADIVRVGACRPELTGAFTATYLGIDDRVLDLYVSLASFSGSSSSFIHVGNTKAIADTDVAARPCYEPYWDDEHDETAEHCAACKAEDEKAQADVDAYAAECQAKAEAGYWAHHPQKPSLCLIHGGAIGAGKSGCSWCESSDVMDVDEAADVFYGIVERADESGERINSCQLPDSTV